VTKLPSTALGLDRRQSRSRNRSNERRTMNNLFNDFGSMHVFKMRVVWAITRVKFLCSSKHCIASCICRYCMKESLNLENCTSYNGIWSHLRLSLLFRWQLKGNLFWKAWTRRSVTSDMRCHRKTLTYLLTPICVP